jgi:hypothetical protein
MNLIVCLKPAPDPKYWDRVQLDLRGFGADPKDYDIRIENRRVGAGLRITADRPLSRLALWAIRAPLSIEPFINMNIEPGTEFTWRIAYDYYTIPKARNDGSPHDDAPWPQGM